MRAFLVLLVASVAWAEYPSKAAMMLLKEGMTRAEVVRFMGEPDRTESKTCGAKTPHPWPCRIWVYEDSERPRFFRIYFEQGKDDWLVNSWD